MRKLWIIAVTVYLFVGIAMGQTAGQCNRQCLEGFMNKYPDAMVAARCFQSTVSANARHTENAKDIHLPSRQRALGCIHQLGMTTSSMLRILNRARSHLSASK